MKRKESDKGSALVELPKDAILNISDYLIVDQDLLSLSSTNKALRELLFPILIDAPFFRDPKDMARFTSLFIPQYKSSIRCLFSLQWTAKKDFEGEYEKALSLLRECKDTLETLSFDGMPWPWKINFAKVLREERFGCLRRIDVKLEEEWEEGDFWLDLLMGFPGNVSDLVVENMKLRDFRLIAKHVKWIKRFRFAMSRKDDYLEAAEETTEEEIRAELKFFFDENGGLVSVKNSDWSWHFEAGLIDWVVLDECFSRGMCLKEEEDEDKAYGVSWERTFKSLPRSIGIERAIQIFHKNEWKINGYKFSFYRHIRKFDPGVPKKLELYYQFVKEFGISFVWVDLDEWMATIKDFLHLKLLDETGKNQNIKIFKLDLQKELVGQPLDQNIFTHFFNGCVHLERIILNYFALKLIIRSTIPNVPISLNLYVNQVTQLQTDLKVFSNTNRLHFHLLTMMRFSILDIIKNFNSLFLYWTQYPIPHNLSITGLFSDESLSPLKVQNLKELFSTTLDIWNQKDYNIVIKVDDKEIRNN